MCVYGEMPILSHSMQTSPGNYFAILFSIVAHWVDFVHWAQLFMPHFACFYLVETPAGTGIGALTQAAESI